MVKKLLIILILIGIFINGCSSAEITEADKKYCEQDSDCVWAFNPAQCCNCPSIYNKDIGNLYQQLVVYEKGKDYSSYRKERGCSDIQCSPCGPITELECKENKCAKKEEQTVKNIEFSCQSDNECDWITTNCCTENAGAFWQCANEIESTIVCPEGKYECAMEEKPKPTESCNCVDNKCQEKDFNFSYHVSVTEWVSGELPADEIGKKPIDTIMEEYRQSFNTIKITDNKVTIQHLFDKPNPCTNVNYTFSKINSKINIIPKKIPDKPVYDPETGEELLTGCVQVIATDFVEINLTLGTGKYDLYFYDYWDISKFSSNRTITIS